MVKDSVCRLAVSENMARAILVYQGQIYYFCQIQVIT